MIPASGWMPAGAVPDSPLVAFPLPQPRVGTYADGGSIAGPGVPQAAVVRSSGGAAAQAVAGRAGPSMRALAVTLSQTDAFGVVLVDSVNFDYVLPAPYLDRAFRVALRVMVMDPQGAWVDLCSLAGRDWVEEVEWDEDLDQPVAQATITLARQSWQGSLAPMLAGSPFNQVPDAVEPYAPLLEPGRQVRVETATTHAGEEPQAEDWKGMFHGYVDEVDWGAGNQVKLAARDLGARLVDTYIEEKDKLFWPADGGDKPPLEVLQLMLDQVLPQAGGRVVAVLEDGPDGPRVPEWMVKPFKQEQKTLMEALRDVALQFGWDVRYRWNEARTDLRLTLYLPERDKTSPDHDLGPEHYLDVTRLATGYADVRNAVKVLYVDDDGQHEVTRTNDISVARYGRRFMEVVEASTSLIDTQGEAESLAGIILSDLSEPGADQEIETLYFWPARLGDLFRFEPNGVHYDFAQQLAAFRVRHSLTREKQRTTVAVRGQPAGAYRDWLRRELRISKGSAPPPPRPVITVQVVSAGREEVVYRVSATVSDGSAIKLYKANGAEPFPAAPLDTDLVPVPRASTAAEDRMVRIRAVSARGGVDEQVISVDFDTQPEVVFVRPPLPDVVGNVRVGWVVEGAVDDDTDSLHLELDRQGTIKAVSPATVAPAAGQPTTGLLLGTAVEKSFLVRVAQEVGERGFLTLTPLAGGVAGEPYVLPLARPPITVATTRQVTLVRREVTLTVTPSDSMIYYSVNDAAVQASSGPSFTLPELDVSAQPATIRFHSTSAGGVAEDEQILRVDLDTAPGIVALAVHEDPANYLVLGVGFDDDVVTWRVWARRDAEPVDARTGTPDDTYQKFMGTANVKSTGWYAGSAEGGSDWHVVVRAYDRTGDFQEERRTVRVMGEASAAGLLQNVRSALNTTEQPGKAFNDVLWDHNAAISADPSSYRVKIYENDSEVAVRVGEGESGTDLLDPRTDHDGTQGSTGAEGVGGWHREVLAAPSSTAPGARYLTFRYRVELLYAGTVSATNYTSVSGWYLGTGEVVEKPTQKPAAPDLLGGRLSATAYWAPPPEGVEVVVEWQTAFGLYGTDADFHTDREYALGPGTERQTLQFEPWTRVRARIAYRNVAGTGDFSDFSESVPVFGTGRQILPEAV